MCRLNCLTGSIHTTNIDSPCDFETGGHYQKMESTYSVWAEVPAQETRLREAMAALRGEFGGPAFEPHVTVLGAHRMPLQKASEALRTLCASLPPYRCSFLRVDSGQDYFQCVYLLGDPSEQVVQANKKAKLTFGQEAGKSAYVPHLSLLYGDLAEEEKARAKARAAELLPQLEATEFDVQRLSLWKTDPQDKGLGSWQKVAELPLEGSK